MPELLLIAGMAVIPLYRLHFLLLTGRRRRPPGFLAFIHLHGIGPDCSRE